MSWFIALQGPLLKVTKAILAMVSNPAMKPILKAILKAPKVKLSAVSLIDALHEDELDELHSLQENKERGR